MPPVLPRSLMIEEDAETPDRSPHPVMRPIDRMLIRSGSSKLKSALKARHRDWLCMMINRMKTMTEEFYERKDEKT